MAGARGGRGPCVGQARHRAGRLSERSNVAAPEQPIERSARCTRSSGLHGSRRGWTATCAPALVGNARAARSEGAGDRALRPEPRHVGARLRGPERRAGLVRWLLHVLVCAPICVRGVADDTGMGGDWRRQPEPIRRQLLGGLERLSRPADIIDGPERPFKTVWFVRFKPEVRADPQRRRDAHDRWIASHGGQFGVQVPGISRYVQNHVVTAIDNVGENDEIPMEYDGYSECWFEDRAAFDLAMASEQWRRMNEDAVELFDIDTRCR